MMKTTKLALCIALAGFATNVLAADGWYAGIGVGQSSVSDWISKDDMLGLLDDFGDEMGVNDFVGSVSASSDDEDTGWKIYGGYQFTPNLAIEAAYLDLGEASASAAASGLFDLGGGFFPGSLYVKATAEATAIVIDGVGKLALAPWLDLFAKAGLYRTELDVTATAGATDTNGVYEASESESDDSTGLHVAVGADFNVMQNVIIRAEWERLSKVDFQDSETDFDLLSISAAYRF